MTTTRPITSTMVAAVTACVFTLAAAQAQQTGQKPNVVIVLADNVDNLTEFGK